MQTYKVKRIENIEIKRKQLFRNKVEIQEQISYHEIEIGDDYLEYKYRFETDEEDEIEVFKMRFKNIQKIFYDKVKNSLYICFTYTEEDYKDMMRHQPFCEDLIDDFEEEDLFEHMYIDNMFKLDLVKFFKSIGLKVNDSQNELTKEEKSNKEFDEKRFGKDIYSNKLERKVLSRKIEYL